MQLSRKFVIPASIAAAAAVVGGGLAINAASASPTPSGTKLVTVCAKDSNNVPVRIYAKAAGCSTGYHRISWDAAAAAPGAPGQDAQLTVTGQVHLVDRADSGRDGSTWALDQFTRTITLTRDHEVAASKCGSTATSCWAYFGIEADTGTFKTVAGAKSPEASTPINGVLTGTAAGSQKFEFYASSDTPDAANLPASENGNDVGSTDMPKQLFGSGTLFSSVTEPTFGYDYNSTATCEQWHDGSTGDTGDIAGVNHCTS